MQHPLHQSLPKKVALNNLNKQILECKKCQLCLTRCNAVAGSGFSKICIIGEAPGYYEDKSGLPFVGRSGDFLSDLLKLADLTRSDVWIGNVIDCRPPENRDPTDEEIVACTGWLEQQLEILDPKLIILLGRISTRLFFPHARMRELRGKTRRLSDGCLVFVSYHPAAALHDPNKRQLIEQDFLSIRRLVRRIRDAD